MALALPPDTSAAEEIAKMAPGAHVVKAFNTTYSQLIHNGAQLGSQRANVFFCGDDAAAKATTGQLAGEIGFDAVDIGPLRMARFLEPFAVIVITLQRLPGMSSDMGYKMITR
jgi:predicted dinucleotide-binding enzyme